MNGGNVGNMDHVCQDSQLTSPSLLRCPLESFVSWFVIRALCSIVNIFLGGMNMSAWWLISDVINYVITDEPRCHAVIRYVTAIPNIVWFARPSFIVIIMHRSGSELPNETACAEEIWKSLQGCRLWADSVSVVQYRCWTLVIKS